MLVVNKKNMNPAMLRANMSSEILREEELDGKTYLVGPIVMIRQGVWNGAYYPNDQLEVSVPGWNGRPVCIVHPEDEAGNQVTANQPKMIKTNVGYVFNTLFEDNKLKAELWIDKEKLGEVSPETLAKLEANEMVEVSTGLFVSVEEVFGEYEGKDYTKMVTNYLPDHLALLPNAVGACSVADGAGFPRFNCADPEQRGLSNMWNWVKSLFGNKQSHEEIRDALRDALQAAHTPDWLYVVQVYDDEVIYELEYKDLPTQLLKRKYTIEDDSIVLDMETVEVQKEIVFKPVTNSKQQQKDTTMDEKEKLVNGLIANENSAFSEDDREDLMALDQALLQKMTVNSEKPAPKAEEPKIEKPAPVANEEKVDLEALKKEIMADVRKEFAANKAAPVRTRLEANEKCLLSKDALARMSEEELLQVEAMLGETNYGAASGGKFLQDNEDTIEDPPELFEG